MSDIPKLTPELELDMKRTLLMLAAKQSGVKITNVYVKNEDGTHLLPYKIPLPVLLLL